MWFIIWSQYCGLVDILFIKKIETAKTNVVAIAFKNCHIALQLLI